MIAPVAIFALLILVFSSGLPDRWNVPVPVFIVGGDPVVAGELLSATPGAAVR
jgi:hypothetical protein